MTHTRNEIHDLVGIGFGPSNLALAVALEEAEAAQGLRTVFLEQKPTFAWHPHMLLEDTVMQISFLKDLVTQRNPASCFSFINYLKAHGRLNDFINMKSFYPTRVEFNRYMGWVAAQLRTEVRYGTSVLSVQRSACGSSQLIDVLYQNPQHAAGVQRVRTRNLVVAVGGMPKGLACEGQSAQGEAVWHSSQYLHKVGHMGALKKGHHFVVVGRGQSAAEIAHDLHGRFPQALVTCLFRGYGLKPSDSSEFVNGLFDAEYVDDISTASPELRDRLLVEHQDTNYSVVDAPLISRLYQIQYKERVEGPVRLKFRNFSQVARIEDGAQGRVSMVCTDTRTALEDTLEADTVVMATGYSYPNPPPVLAAIASDFQLERPGGRPRVNRHYRVAMHPGADYGVYLQGCNEATHGLSDTLLSNLSIRAGEILGDLLGQPAARSRVSAPQPQPESRSVAVASLAT